MKMIAERIDKRLSKNRSKSSENQKPPKFHFNFRNLARELTLTPKFLQDVTGRLDISIITTLNLQFKDNRFPKLRQISQMHTMPNLKTLNLSFNEIERIEGLSCLTGLVELNLSENRIRVVENLVSVVRRV
eukprot:TRINITY_DN4677_c0_g3_i1.p2 TRINITY_DN4677_c0_g3~~TRINITY_DN4677_c0_g3_i1.p2  ORF type:complete len:131 (-),score=24.60 TRINITY_DN4677_c0_g3_i1:85-477(-)